MKNTIDKSKASTWRKRWDKLAAERFTNEHEVAKLAHEIREEFPFGPSGDLQFRCSCARRCLARVRQRCWRSPMLLDSFQKDSGGSLGVGEVFASC